MQEFTQKFLYFVAKIARMDALFEASFSPLADSGKPLSKCGRCQRYMKYIAARPSRLYCAHCEEVYNVPQVCFGLSSTCAGIKGCVLWQGGLSTEVWERLLVVAAVERLGGTQTPMRNAWLTAWRLPLPTLLIDGDGSTGRQR